MRNHAPIKDIPPCLGPRALLAKHVYPVSLGHHMLPFTGSTMWLAILLALGCLTSDSHGAHSPGKRGVIWSWPSCSSGGMGALAC